MKKLGFTLVELLAVIAILAILIIIALPNVLKLYNEAQMKMFLQEAQNINKAAKDSYLSQQMGTTALTETTITYTDGEESINGNIDVNYTGKKPDNGKLIIREDGKTALAFHDGKYCVTKSFGSDEIIINNSAEDECIVTSVTPSSCFAIDTGGMTDILFDEETEVVIYSYYTERAECSQDVIIPSKIGGKNVVGIGGDTFHESGITSVVIPNGVRVIGSWAFGRSQLTSITIPNSVTTIGWAAFMGNDLTSITIPNSVTTIEDAAFSSNQLTSVTLPASLTSIGRNPFTFNPSLMTITIDSNNPEYMSSNNAIYTKDGKTLVSGTKTSSNSILNTTTTIGNSAFDSMEVTSVTLPSSVKIIEANAFSDNQLASVIIPSGVTTIQQSAFLTNQLTSVAIPNTVTTIGEYAFASNQLSTVTIPSSVTSIGNYAFTYNQLTSVLIQGKSSSSEFTAYSYNIWGWASGYGNSNIIWNAP
jgi:prepilin-type N-terminal cleavage/methylation domain-containing protein